ncbi:MAG: hypothetical protein ACEQSF_01960 [Solirubrobacteraceae bacterium]
MIKYKKCNCDEDYWEEIVVQNDENYQNKNVIYFHCSLCGEDFRVEDFESNKELIYLDIKE